MPQFEISIPYTGKGVESYRCRANETLNFEFPLDDVTGIRRGDDLELLFESKDGDEHIVTLLDFFTAYKSSALFLLVEGKPISASDLLESLDMEVPLLDKGGRFHGYEAYDLLSGINRLDGLDLDSSRSLDVEGFHHPTAQPSRHDHGVVAVPGGALLVDEAELGGAALPTASGSMTISAPDGIGSITIGGVIVFADGAPTDAVVRMPEGFLKVTGFDPQTGSLSYAFTLEHAAGHGQPGRDSLSRELAVTVTDADGSTASSSITVTIVDDVPVISSVGRSIAEGDAAPLSGSVMLEGDGDYGADGAGSLVWTPGQKASYGSIVFGEDGSYTYTLDNSLDAVKGLSNGQSLKETFTYTVIDADGDAKEATLTITINGVDHGVVAVPGGALLVDEAELGGAALPTASGSMTISAPDGIGSITIGGVIVFADGAPTDAVVRMPEGFLKVTGFDPQTGSLSYAFTLEHAAGHGQPGRDSLSRELAVTVTDADGSTASSSITVTIVDDVPVISSVGRSIAEGDAAPLSGSVMLEGDGDYGADGAGSLVWTPGQKASYGSIVFGEDGSYTYTLDNSLDAVKGLFDGEILEEEFTYTIMDADGDTKTETLTITINGKSPELTITPKNPLYVDADNLTVHESSLNTPAHVSAEEVIRFLVRDGDGSLSYGTLNIKMETGKHNNAIENASYKASLSSADKTLNSYVSVYEKDFSETNNKAIVNKTIDIKDITVLAGDKHVLTFGNTSIELDSTLSQSDKSIFPIHWETQYGTVTLKNIESGKVYISYELNQICSSSNSINESLSFDVRTWSSNSTYESTLDCKVNITIYDDRPSVDDVFVDMGINNDAIHGNVIPEDMNYGADGKHHEKPFEWDLSNIAPERITYNEDGSCTVKNDFGQTTLYPDGTYSSETFNNADRIPSSDIQFRYAEGAMIIHSSDGVGTISINGVIVYKDNTLISDTYIDTDEGYLEVISFDETTGELTYVYTLEGPTQEHTAQGKDNFIHPLDITVTDINGVSESSSIHINIFDDVPTSFITSNNENGTTAFIHFGADGPAINEYGVFDNQSMSISIGGINNNQKIYSEEWSNQENISFNIDNICTLYVDKIDSETYSITFSVHDYAAFNDFIVGKNAEIAFKDSDGDVSQFSFTVHPQAQPNSINMYSDIFENSFPCAGNENEYEKYNETNNMEDTFQEHIGNAKSYEQYTIEHHTPIGDEDIQSILLSQGIF